MKLVVILGDSAVGKMTVGQELMKQTGLRLFHNHMAIELVLEVFGKFSGNAVYRIRDVIFEEFKGTGNMELHLDRKLSEKRVFPAIDINKSGTRKEELLLSEKELNSVFSIRRALSNLGTADVTEMIVGKMLKTKNNEEFINTIKIFPQDGSKG